MQCRRSDPLKSHDVHCQGLGLISFFVKVGKPNALIFLGIFEHDLKQDLMEIQKSISGRCEKLGHLRAAGSQGILIWVVPEWRKWKWKGAHQRTWKRLTCAQDPNSPAHRKRNPRAQDGDSPAHRRTSMRVQPLGLEIRGTGGGTGEQGGNRAGTGATGKGSWEKPTFRWTGGYPWRSDSLKGCPAPRNVFKEWGSLCTGTWYTA